MAKSTSLTLIYRLNIFYRFTLSFVVGYVCMMYLSLCLTALFLHSFTRAEAIYLAAFFHNVSSVLALPFFLTITFTGLAIFFYLYLPWGMKQLYPEKPFQYFTEIRTISQTTNIDSPPTQTDMQPITVLLDKLPQQWENEELATIEVKNPNTNQAKITFKQLEDHSITLNQTQITLDGAGEILGNTRNNSPVATLNAGVYGLHMATFAQPLLRFALS